MPLRMCPSSNHGGSRFHTLARVVAMLIAVASVNGGPLAAVEIELRNDSFESGGPAVIVGDFIPFEQAGVRLTSPCHGNIVAVQIGWLSGKPQDPSLETAIHIYAGDTFPTPGAELEILVAPVLTSGFLNEFRHLDKGMGIPLSVPVEKGDEFYVTLEFANPTDVANGGASVFRDIDGCQSGRNVLFALPGSWLDFCIFLQGDLVIRAVVECTEGQGACCFDNGTCINLERDVCEGASGTYQGPDTVCAETECPDAEQACCFEGAGCIDLSPLNCLSAGGIPNGPGTRCADIICFPMGACCFVDGSCGEDLSPKDCEAANGLFQGDQTLCEFVDCPAPDGACCFNEFCLVICEADCLKAGATWFGEGTDCADLDKNGTPDECEDNCPADASGNGEVDFLDILAILAVWGPCPECPEDINGNGEADFLDILMVLAQWGPCP